MQTVVRLNTTKCASPNVDEHRQTADCAVFTGAGSRPCGQSEPLSWAMLRILQQRPMWCWTAHDLTSPLFLETTRHLVPEIRDHDRVGVVRYSAHTAPGLGCDGGGYGVWFFVMPGSDVEVDVGRILTFDTKIQAIEFAQQQTNLNATYTLPCTQWNNEVGPRCEQHGDTELCEAVRRVGRDSALIRNINYGRDAVQPTGTRTELILCTHGRVDAPQCDACLPWDVVPLYNASSGQRYRCSADEWRIPFGYDSSHRYDDALPMQPALVCDKTACAVTALAGGALLLIGIVCLGMIKCRTVQPISHSTTSTPSPVARRRARYNPFDKEASSTSPSTRVRWLSGALIASILVSAMGGIFLSACTV